VVGWSQRRQLSLLTAALAVFINNGCHQQGDSEMEPIKLIVVIHDGDGNLCR
jgi:hypothetical protein